jgi:hypothetical protein
VDADAPFFKSVSVKAFCFFSRKPPEYSGIFQDPKFFSFLKKERRGNERKSRTFRVKRGMKYGE